MCDRRPIHGHVTSTVTWPLPTVTCSSPENDLLALRARLGWLQLLLMRTDEGWRRRLEWETILCSRRRLNYVARPSRLVSFWRQWAPRHDHETNGCEEERAWCSFLDSTTRWRDRFSRRSDVTNTLGKALPHCAQDSTESRPRLRKLTRAQYLWHSVADNAEIGQALLAIPRRHYCSSFLISYKLCPRSNETLLPWALSAGPSVVSRWNWINFWIFFLIKNGHFDALIAKYYCLAYYILCAATICFSLDE